MAIKLCRTFFGRYTPNYQTLSDRKYLVIKPGKRIITVLNANQGFGRIEGTVQKLGVNYNDATLVLFKKSTRSVLWETKPKRDGSYAIRNIALGLECFIVGFDNSGEYNAVIDDALVAG